MPRRMITSDINFNEKFASLSDAGRLLFIGIFSNADDDGRLKASAKFLKAHIFPYDIEKTVEHVQELRDQCNEVGLIRIYTNGDKDVLDIPGWLEHQSIRKDRYTPSKLPDFKDCQPYDNQLSPIGCRSLGEGRGGEYSIKDIPLETKGISSHSKSKNKQKDKKTTSPPSEVTQVLKFIEEKIGQQVPYPAKENNHIKRALDMGFTVEEIKGCWELMKGMDFWRDKWLSLSKVTENLGEYRAGRLKNGKKRGRVEGSRPKSDFEGDW